jgi:hypothetical protein
MAGSVSLSPLSSPPSARYEALEERRAVALEPDRKRARGLSAALSWLVYLWNPADPERRRLNARRRLELPAHLRLPEQIMGRSHHSCGATYGVLERCNFACTSCYLSKEANRVPPLEPKEVKGQLDALRAFLGPQGKAQLTAGEVTLLPREVLGSYIRYAKAIGLDPMVMSHGERFLAQPDYLRDLMVKDGLEKISIHVDTTQRGRSGWRKDLRERDLREVRERYAKLLRHLRSTTGRKLHAAHTVTVTERNLAEVEEIVSWAARNCDAFRMVSFQPVAEVGRTEDQRPADLSLAAVWKEICAGLGAEELNPRGFLFGHPECNIVAPLVIVRSGPYQLILEPCRRNKNWDRRFLERLMVRLGGFSTIGRSPVTNALALLSLALQNLPLLAEVPFYAAYRLGSLRRELVSLAAAMLRHRQLSIRPLALVVHKFMSPEELTTELGQERLQACVFKVPVGSKMTSMCELNATDLRSRLNEQQRGSVPA